MTAKLRAALTETFCFYLRAHIFHWNVVGPSFVSMHALFGDIYADAHKATDDIAEHIRTLDELAPETALELLRGAKIKFQKSGSWHDMVDQLEADNEVVIGALVEAYKEAGNNYGLSNFLQDRLDRHAKWKWMLKATRG